MAVVAEENLTNSKRQKDIRSQKENLSKNSMSVVYRKHWKITYSLVNLRLRNKKIFWSQLILFEFLYPLLIFANIIIDDNITIGQEDKFSILYLTIGALIMLIVFTIVKTQIVGLSPEYLHYLQQRTIILKESSYKINPRRLNDFFF